MKKVSEATMRTTNGGYYYCKACGKKMLTYAGALLHTTAWTMAFGIGSNSNKHWKYINQK